MELTATFMGFGHFSDYHRFFSQASWKIDDLWQTRLQPQAEDLQLGTR